MKTTKTLIALAVSLAAFGATAQVDQAAKDASQAAQHRAEQQRAESKATESGTVGKAVNNTKAEYHKKMAEHNEKEAVKEAREGMGTTKSDSKASKIATDANDALNHKADQKRAENKAANSGPVGKAVNNTKAEYHKGMAEHNANEVKEELGVKKDKGVVIRRDSSVTPAVPSASSTSEGGPGMNNGTPPATTPKR